MLFLLMLHCVFLRLFLVSDHFLFSFLTEVSCPHLSLPVEMDESMTSSSLNLAWPVCQECSVHFDDVTPARGDITRNDEREVECPDACFRRRDLATFPEAARRVKHLWNVPSEDEESLEPPLPLHSYEGESESRIARFGPTHSRTCSYRNVKCALSSCHSLQP